MVWASNTGCRSAAKSTAVPKRTRWVAAPIADRAAKGSMRGLAVRLSPTQTESRPADSTSHARSSTVSALLGGSSLNKIPRVGSSTPSFTLLLDMLIQFKALKGTVWIPGQNALCIIVRSMGCGQTNGLSGLAPYVGKSPSHR